MNATTEVTRVSLSKLKWGGMFSAWGQDDKFYQGICYGSMNGDPQRYFKLGKAAPPVIKLFPRWVDNATATWWLDTMFTHFIPKEVARYIRVTRLRNKNDWPAKWQTTVPNVEILDLNELEWNDEEGNFRPDDPQWRKARTGKYRGLKPFLRVEFDQEINVKSMFTAASLFRFVSEQVPKIVLLKLMCERWPKANPASLIFPASCFAPGDGHNFGSMYYGNAETIAEVVKTWNFRDAWSKMAEGNLKPFYTHPKREWTENVDSYFCPDPEAANSTKENHVYPNASGSKFDLDFGDTVVTVYGNNIGKAFRALDKEFK